jgi:hypothetical protein
VRALRGRFALHAGRLHGSARVLTRIIFCSCSPTNSRSHGSRNPTPTPNSPGQGYWWNESTGETTDIGEPRPSARFRDQAFRGAGDARFQEGWREPPEADNTVKYSLLGALMGFTAGWGTQYFH